MIDRLQVTHLRNITRADLKVADCNVFIGANGSGKTSLLEAVFLLSRGKSFRHHQPKRYIQHHQAAVTVHAALTDATTLAIQKQLDATTMLRLNQNTVYTQSPLTQQLPTLLIDPSSMDMLEQGSASRRQLLDWLAFHMKPGFHPQWLAYQRLLKQRNKLLKQSRQLSNNQRQELSAWDKGLANHAALIHYYRQQVFNDWQPYFERCVAALLPRYAGKISLSYMAGYDADTPLDEQLAERLTQDLQQGFTRIGSHRADIQVHWRSQTATKETSTLKEQAANVLSRGEKKLLITALKLSQLPLLLADNGLSAASGLVVEKDPLASTTGSFAMEQSEVGGTVAAKDIEADSTADITGFTPIVLLDDVTAELDEAAIQILLSTLAALKCQVFITSLTEDILPLLQQYWPGFKLFHVKQGVISAPI
ncbi:DNA replication/repair protein RecF [Psychrobacter arenosus]|uniref:DNA replication/repair protein RecF n=1 Tax=Psychrobacter arenosus TaxID=256326 RepID=UPI00191ABCD7|nr:DNA replication and repair protein RecF [Psychrobacter arenosus]